MTEAPTVESWVEPVPFPDRKGWNRRRTRSWALVLEARGIPYRRRPLRPGGVSLVVPPEFRERAEAEIRAYVSENRRPTVRERPTVRNGRRTFAVLVALGLFHDLTFQPPGRVLGIAVDWHGLGTMDAGKVVGGQWWRAITALTLHADGPHLMGNLLLGGILLGLLNRELGVGLGTALVLVAGALGNLTNAFVRDPGHLSVGASTAVFAALGALTARSAGHPGRVDWRRWVAPLGAGAGVIAMTGVGDARTDYLAHLFGFGWGLVGGGLTVWPRPKRAPGGPVSVLAGGAAAVAVIAAWALALAWI